MNFEVISSLIDPTKEQETRLLKEFLLEVVKELWYGGVLYLGYPIVSRWEEDLKLDAIWISKDCWILIFSILNKDTSEENICYEEEYQKKIYGWIFSKIVNTDGLTDIEIWSAPKPKIDISVITFAPSLDPSKFFEKWFFWDKRRQKYSLALNKEELKKEVKKKSWNNIEDIVYKKTIATIQDIINLKVKKNRGNLSKGTKWYKLERIEDTMAQLDPKQEKTILGFFDGIQRIRWLAWSWKTIILALKVALFHSNNPNAKIAVTFNTRSQKQQFESLIKKFCISKMSKEPNWDNIKVVQAWWSPSSEGIYYNFCVTNGVEYSDFKKAQFLQVGEHRDKELLDIVCTKALKDIEGSWKQPIEQYDIIFVDEAQDLSTSFLRICYKSLFVSQLWKRKLVYAYDELQKLNEGFSLPEPQEIFSTDIDSDDILYKCYRNSKEIIATAHALGLWVYREGWLVQFFWNPSLWSDIWYLAEENSAFKYGEETTLSRTRESSPSYFNELFSSGEFIHFQYFSDVEAQSEWVATQIEKDIKEGQLLPGDIMVINPIALTTKREVALIRLKLAQKWIQSHIAWAVNADIFYEDWSVTLTWINRAKWNEVWMVYIINADDCFKWRVNDSYNLQKLRNILFTSITRSKAWVRVCGTWNGMQGLIKEHEKLKEYDYKLKFSYPSEQDRKKLDTIYKTIDKQEEQQLQNNHTGLSKNISWIFEVIENIKKGIDGLENYSKEEQEFLKNHL